MSDLSINANQINKPIDTQIVTKNADTKDTASVEVKKDDGIITSKAIENSKIEADTLTKEADTKKKETPIITNEMIDKLDKLIKNEGTKEKVKEKAENKAMAETLKAEAEKAKEKIKIGQKEKHEPKNVADIIQKKKEAKELKKAEKQAKAEQKAQAENSKIAKKVVTGKDGKTQTIKVKLVKDENGKWKAERPNTLEYQERNGYMQNVKKEYAQKSPEPPFSEDGSNEGSESAEHAKWKKEYNKHMQNEEKAYQESHKAYQLQYFEYKKAQRKAEEMNK